jgi:hypothetical protein
MLLTLLEWSRELSSKGSLDTCISKGHSTFSYAAFTAHVGERVDEIAVGVLCQPLQGHRAAGGTPEQAFQLIAPMRGDLSVGMERKALHTGTAGTGQCGMFPSIAKPRADAPDLLAGSLPKGDALLHGGRMVRASSGASSRKGS